MVLTSRIRCRPAAAVLLIPLCCCDLVAQSGDENHAPADFTASDSMLPAAAPCFVRNEGQWNPELLFVADLPRGFILVFADRVLIQQIDHLEAEGAKGFNAVLPFAARWSATTWEIESPRAAALHYFRGATPKEWKRGVATGRVLRGRESASNAAIVMELSGAALHLRTEAGPNGSWPFDMGAWSHWPSRADASMDDEVSLVLDLGELVQGPMSLAAGSADAGLTWSAQLGASFGGYPQCVALHEDGRVTVVGETKSPDFPTTPGAWDITFGGGGGNLPFDIFVSGLSADGATLEFSTFLGGTNTEHALGCVPTQDGGIIVAGRTFSSNYPLTAGVIDSVFSKNEAFITRLTPSGDDLLLSTFLGGKESDLISEVALMPDHSILVVGSTDSSDFPVTGNAFDTVGGVVNGSDGFITRLSPDASSLQFSSYLGAPGIANGDGIGPVAVVDSDRIVVAGVASPGTLVAPGEFIALIDTARGEIQSSFSFDAGSGGGGAARLAVAPDGGIIAAGIVGDFTALGTPGSFDPTFNGQHDGFIARLPADLSGFDWFTYYGDGHIDQIYNMSLDAAGHVTVSGRTSWMELPTTAGALQEQSGGLMDFFVARFHRDGDRLLYGSYVGGSGHEYLPAGTSNEAALALDPQGGAVIAGTSISPDYPLTPGAYGADAGPFLVKAVVTRLTLLPVGVTRLGTSTPGCKGELLLGVTAQPRVGASDFGVYAGNAVAHTSKGILLLGLAPAQSPTFVKQAQLWLDPAALIAVIPWATDATGYVELPLRIPDDPAVVGLQAWVQGLFRDHCAAGQVAATPALALTIQP